MFRRGFVPGSVERGGGRRCLHETLLHRHDSKVRLALRVRVDSVVRHPGEIRGG